MTDHLGPRKPYQSETTSKASSVGAKPGAGFGVSHYARPLTGALTLVALIAVVALAVGLFRGSFTKSVPLTVLSDRAGLVMNPDARVKMRGVQVGKVASIENRPDGTAALHLAMDPDQMHLIPSNVNVDISSSTVFGSKFVDLVAPEQPSPKPLAAGQVLDAEHVTVEINTVFQQLTNVLDKIDPPKLNETLGAIAKAFNGRGEKIGQTLTDLDQLLAKLDPSMTNLEHELEVLPPVAAAYADAAPDLLSTADNATKISQTLVDKQTDLDTLLVSATGLADIGNDVLGGNRQALTDVLHLLVPTTDLLARYQDNIRCGIGGIAAFSESPPLPDPGVLVSIAFTLGIERYRYPHDLPKVAAKSGSLCESQKLPNTPPDWFPPHVVADVGANPWQYGNQGILLNSDGLKQMLFGQLDGPPRNTLQFGQPG
ncbi:MAG: MCE family protein [Mycobacterium sp.]|nr:MCE family protein [Mycobacterium sp.]